MEAQTPAEQRKPTPTGAATRFLGFALGFWRASGGRTPTLLALAILGLLGVNLAINLGLYNWQRWIFDMLESCLADSQTKKCALLASATPGAVGWAPCDAAAPRGRPRRETVKPQRKLLRVQVWPSALREYSPRIGANRAEHVANWD